MKKNKKESLCKRGVIVTAIVASIAIIIVLFYINQWEKSIPIENYSFSETQDINFSFNNTEIQNINEVLTRLCIEDESYYGFSNSINAKVDLYQAYSAINLMTLIPDYDLTSIKEKLSFLFHSNISQFDFLNLMYYVDLCEKLGIKLDYVALNDALVKYYDKKTNLFYLDDEGDTINIKLIATAMVKNILKDNLSTELFCPVEGIKKAYSEYSFVMQNDVTLYNSGGDVLYCISAYEIDSIIDKASLKDWYEYWKNIYEGTEINSQVCAVQYAEYLNVARIFEPDYSAKKLQDYYNGLTTDIIEGYDELNILYNFMKNVNMEENSEIVIFLRDKIVRVVESENFVVSNIDVKSTAFGVMLAKKSGFEINEEKINRYIKDNYKKEYALEQIYNRTSNLYYNLILDQLINGYEQDYDESYFQSQVDDILEILDYNSQSIVADVISTRRIVEIVSDLQIFDVDIKLTKAQKEKIQIGLEKALQINEICASFLINDMYIVDRLLNLEILSDKKVIEVYDSLTIEGGTCAAKDSELTPDVNSTYQFYVSLSRMNNYVYLEQQQEFIENLKIRDAIYACESENGYLDLSAIVYANAIYNFELGGDKFD